MLIIFVQSTEKENVKASDIVLEVSRNVSTHSDEDDDEVFFDAESDHEENADDKAENQSESVNSTPDVEELVDPPPAVGEVWYAPKCICILSQWVISFTQPDLNIHPLFYSYCCRCRRFWGR